ncbi:lysophospholipid acyltransferase family protein [Marinoscillum sp. MHG1-6]|uniref:lysophospholipid acyltransferase family protein n=1 Tax=Marinoscillum sp. MHG1-6 TaxID=2959627 RepID=UPI00215872F8|nr:lysophospholipid acyltransferase family protein [Marinoscillum sp. MHG1-6]
MASVLYYPARSLMRLALNGFFRHIEVIGRENLPESGPTIYIGNHPSMLMDPLVISILVKPKLHFLTAAEFMGKGFREWLLKSQFNLIPVYRRHIPEYKHISNDEMFSACYDCLSQGKSFLIFPEGISITENRLKPLKTGVARILLGFQDTNPIRPVTICPIGLNYQSAHHFQSAVTVKVGQPKKLSDFSVDPNSEDAVADLTDQIEQFLKDQIIHIENPELDDLVKNVTRIYRHSLERSLNLSKEDTEQRFQLEQQIVHATEYFFTRETKKVQNIASLIKEYIEEIKHSDIREHYLEEHIFKLRSSDLLTVFLLFPFFLVGIVITGVPYVVARLVFRTQILPRLSKEETNESIDPGFAGTLSFSIGASIFLLWFLILSLFLVIKINFWIGVIGFFWFYALGQISLLYTTSFYRIYYRWRHKGIIKKYPDQIAALAKKRENILNQLDAFRISYEQNVAQQ